MNSVFQYFTQKQNISRAIILTASLIIAVTLLSLFFCCFSRSFWLDEAYSLHIARYNWGQLFIETATHDVHPPLYYILLKFVIDTGVRMTTPEHNVFFGKFLSFIAIVCSLLLTGIKVWRQHGRVSVAVLCAMGMCAAPSILLFGEEIRMYAWAIFFVTGTYLWAWDVIQRGKKRDWFYFCLFGLLSAYTHHFACISVAFIYLGLLVHICLRKRDSFRPWLLCAIASAVCYLPWLIVTYMQTCQVQADWWLKTPTKHDYLNCLYFAYQNNLIIVLLATLVVGLVLRNVLIYKKYDFRSVYIMLGIMLPMALFSTGIILSWLIRPILVSRYLSPGVGCMWIALILGIATKKEKILHFLVTCVLIFSLTAYNLFNHIRDEFVSAQRTTEVVKLTKGIPNAAILFLWESSAKTFMEKSGNDCYLWAAMKTQITIPPYGTIKGILQNEQDLQALTESNKTILFACHHDNNPECEFPGMNLCYIPILNEEKENKHWFVTEIPFRLYRVVLKSER